MDANAQDIFFMNRALELAKKAESSGEVPVGAIAITDNEIVGEGYNCPIGAVDCTSHAEIVALRDASQRLNNYRLPGLTLYVTLEPCVMCVGAIIQARIKHLVFGAMDPKSGAVVSVFRILDEKTLNHRVEYTGGVLAAESGAILSSFFQAKR